MSLPHAHTEQDFDKLDLDAPEFRIAVAGLTAKHGIRCDEPLRFNSGSLPVFAIGDELVVKLYPQVFLGEADHEAAWLGHLHARLPIKTPKLEARGDLDGWAYVIMSRLPGRLLSDAWEELKRADQHRLAEDLGHALAALHALESQNLPSTAKSWPIFVGSQRAGCVARQRKLGLDEAWLQQIPDFLAEVELGTSTPDVPLHTEVMREHLFVEEREGRAQLSGLFDFEPSMLGAAEYEFASVGLFFACGDASIFRRVLGAYGYQPGDLNRELQRRCMSWGLLHRYSHLPWYMRRIPPSNDIKTLDGLAALWWRLDSSG